MNVLIDIKFMRFIDPLYQLDNVYKSNLYKRIEALVIVI